MRAHSLTNKITLPIKGGLQVVAVSDIIYVQSDDMWVCVRMVDATTLRVPLTIKSLSEKKLTHFIRSHRSFLVNPIHVVRYDKACSMLSLSTGVEVPVSRRKRSLVSEQLRKELENN